MISQKKIDDENRFNEHINNLASKPGQEWIGQLSKLAKDKPDSAHLQQVAAAVKQWDYKAEGLTPEAAAVVVIVVTYFTAGTGGAAATAGTAATTATGSAIVGAAVAAGVTTLASQAAISIINNKGDVGKTLDDLSKEEKVRSVVTAMITAGVLQSMNEINYVHKLNQYNAKSDFTDLLQKNLVNNTASTLVNNAINGGDLRDQLNQGFRNAFFDTTAARGANWIGDKKADDILNAFTHKLAHAVAGCVIGAARADDCRSGALGAVVGEISAELYANKNGGAPLTSEQKTDTVNFAKMIAGISAAATGNDVNLAAAAGGMRRRIIS
jgi:filamentous hemagglutinin